MSNRNIEQEVIEEEEEQPTPSTSKSTNINLTSKTIFGYEHLKCLSHLLKTYQTIDLIAFLDDLLNQNIDYIYKDLLINNPKSYFLPAVLTIQAIVAAKLGLKDLAAEKIQILIDKSLAFEKMSPVGKNNTFLNSYSAGIQVNKILNRIDKVDHCKRQLKIKSDLIKSQTAGVAINSNLSNLYDDVIMQQICVCFLLPGGFGECLRLAKKLSKNFKSAELDYIYLFIGIKFNTHILRNESPPIFSFEVSSFGPLNQCLVGLMEMQNNAKIGDRNPGQNQGLNTVKSAIRSAVISNSKITIDRLISLLLSFGKYKLALTAAAPNLEIPTKIALYTKAIVQYNLYHSLHNNSTPEQDLELLREAEEIFSSLLEDNPYPNFNVTINLIRIRFLMMQLFPHIVQFGEEFNPQDTRCTSRNDQNLEITKASISNDLRNLNSKINALNKSKHLVSHIELARIEAQIFKEKTYEILFNALKTSTINHSMTCFILTELISHVINFNKMEKILELDSLISMKILDKRHTLTTSNKKILRGIFKCEGLNSFVDRATSNGFLNLSKLCFAVISLSDSQIENILYDKKLEKIN